MKKFIALLLAIAVGAVVVLFVMAGIIDGTIWLTGVLHLHHALGMDTQSSENYALPSGTLPCIIAVFGFSSVFATALKHINCEEPGCWRPGHRHPGHGRPVCRKHYHSDVVPEP